MKHKYYCYFPVSIGDALYQLKLGLCLTIVRIVRTLKVNKAELISSIVIAKERKKAMFLSSENLKLNEESVIGIFVYFKVFLRLQ